MHRVPAVAARLILGSLLALSAVSSPAWALANLPSSPPSSWIHDGASLLSASERSELAARKQQLEQQTGTRLVVVTLSSDGGEGPKAIAVRALNQWNAGRRSALLLVLMSPRELYIQPGTELASLLDASSSSSICSSVVAPKMRSGDRAAALRAGLEAMASRISSGSGASSARTEEDILPTAETRKAAVPLQSFGESAESSSSSSWAWLGWLLGLSGLGGGIWGLSLLFSKKCDECGKRMTKSSRTIEHPTTWSAGEGEHTYSCGGCGYTFAETYVIAQIVERTTTTTDTDTSSSWSSNSWSSSSSDSSWSSSSSDSSSSSSSSSSDNSGGGGSTW